MEIVTQEPKYREDFIRLNTKWLTRFYWVESFDQYAMEHVEERIAQGAMAFFALDDREEVLATCMSMQRLGKYANWRQKINILVLVQVVRYCRRL